MMILWIILSILLIAALITVVLSWCACKRYNNIIHNLINIIDRGDNEAKEECVNLYSSDFERFLDKYNSIEG